MRLSYKPRFLRKVSKLSSALQEEVLEKLEMFSDPKNHERLKVHKLQGRMKGRWSFSVNYRYRIVFEWGKQNESAVLLSFGDHSVYD